MKNRKHVIVYSCVYQYGLRDKNIKEFKNTHNMWSYAIAAQA